MPRQPSKAQLEARAQDHERHDRLKEILIEWGPLSWSELQEVSGYSPNTLYKVMCMRPTTRESFHRCGNRNVKAETWWLE